MMGAPIAETDLARAVVAHLADLQYDVHQEVTIGGGGFARADIVGVLGEGSRRLVHVVEVKRSMSLDVIAQAMNWRSYAHHVSIAVPATKVGGSRARWLAQRICRDEGIGVLTVRLGRDGDAADVREDAPPRYQRIERRFSHIDRLLACLCDETRTYAAAGNADNRYWTPFRRTCENVVGLLRRRGPLTTRDLVAGIDHHYASPARARGALGKWLEAGKVAGVERVPDSSPWQWRAAA